MASIIQGPDFACVATAFETLSEEFAKIKTSEFPSASNSIPSATVEAPDLAEGLVAIHAINETLVAIHRAQSNHEKAVEQKLATLTTAVERLETNLPKQIAVEYAQINGRMHNMTQSDAANGRLLPLPDDRGLLPPDFPKTSTIFALIDDEEILKLLVFYGLSTVGDHKERRNSLAAHCGVRIPQ